MSEGFPPPRIEKGSEPEAKRSPELERAAPVDTETYDRAYWTPDRIRSNVASFFEKLERNEQRLRAERERLLEQAVKEAEARRLAEKAIAEREMAEAENQRMEQFQQEIVETEEQRKFRHTIEWMIEQKPDQIHDLAINFLGSAGAKIQNIKDETT